MKVQIGWSTKKKSSGVVPVVGVPAYITPTPTSLAPSSGLTTGTVSGQTFSRSNALLSNNLNYYSENPSIIYVNPTTGVWTRVGVGSTNIVETIGIVPTYNQNGMIAKATFDTGGVGSWDLTLDGTVASVVDDPSGLLGGKVLKFVYSSATSGTTHSNIYANLDLHSGGFALGSTFWMRMDIVFLSSDDITTLGKLFYPKMASYPNNGWITGGENNNVGYGYMTVRRRDTSAMFDTTRDYILTSGLIEAVNQSTIPVVLMKKYRVRLGVTLNSDFDTTDGRIQLFINGVLALDLTGLTWSDPLWKTFSTAWDPAVSYGTGALVKYAGQVWSNMLDSGISGANLNHTPGTDSTWLVPDKTKQRFSQFAIGEQMQRSPSSPDPTFETRLYKNIMVSAQDMGDGDPTPGDI